MTPGEKAEFVKQVQDFAGSDAVEKLLLILEEKYVTDWKHSLPTAGDARVHAYMMVRAIDELRNEIKSIALNDRFVSASLDRKSKTI